MGGIASIRKLVFWKVNEPWRPLLTECGDAGDSCEFACSVVLVYPLLMKAYLYVALVSRELMVGIWRMTMYI
jgi:hypothetical protein